MKPFTQKEKRLAERIYTQLLPTRIGMNPGIHFWNWMDAPEKIKGDWCLIGRWHLNEIKKVAPAKKPADPNKPF